MFYKAKSLTLKIDNTEIDYITFGKGTKLLIMIQGLSTRGIKGAAVSLAYMYRVFAKEYKVFLFDRRPTVWEGITVREMASDVAKSMDVLGLKVLMCSACHKVECLHSTLQLTDQIW